MWYEKANAGVKQVEYTRKKIFHCPRSFSYDIWITHNLCQTDFQFSRFVAVGYKTSILIVFLQFYAIFYKFFSRWDTREARRRCLLSLIPCFIPFLRTIVW